jgi:hypothetical protein
MARLAAEHRALSDALAPARDGLTAYAAELFTRRPWEEIPARVRALVARAEAVPGWGPVDAGAIEAAVRDAAIWEAACRAVRTDPGACDSADGIRFEGERDCRVFSRWLEFSGRLARNEDVESAARGTIVPSDSPPGAAGGVGALLRGDASRCGSFARPDEGRGGWAGALCQATASRSRTPCDAVEPARRASTCRVLAMRLIEAAGHEPWPAEPADAAALRVLDGLATGTDCAARAVEWLASDAAVAAAFSPWPLELPEVERRRGLAPPP